MSGGEWELPRSHTTHAYVLFLPNTTDDVIIPTGGMLTAPEVPIICFFNRFRYTEGWTRIAVGAKFNDLTVVK